MHQVRLGSIFLSLFILFIGSLIGWLVGESVIDEEKSGNFLLFIITTPSIIFLFQICLYRNATKWLYHQLYFIGSISMTLAWFMIAFALPIFWSDKVGIYTKMLTLFVSSTLCVSNIQFAQQSFNKKWDQYGQSAFDNLFKLDTKKIDWARIVRSMKHDFDVYIPGLNKNSSNFVAIIAVGVLIVGQIIRDIYPVFRMLAWAFSFSVVASWLFHIAAYTFMHARKVRALEKKYNLRFEST